MNFSLNKNELTDALITLIKITPTRTTLPILSTVLIKTEEDKGVRIRTTDLEVDMEFFIQAKILEQGETCAPIHRLYEIINTLTEENLTININEAQRMKIKTQTGQYFISCNKTEEFPEDRLVEGEPTKISAKFLNDTIRNTLYATSKDELKPTLNGVLLSCNSGGITAVATDGHRLVKYVYPQKNTEATTTLIPQKFLQIISGGTINVKKAELEIYENHAIIKTTNKKISTRLIKEKFPDYDNVIPEKNPNTTKVNTQELLNKLKRVSLMSNKTTKQVVLKLNENKITASAEDHETGGSAVDEIDSQHTGKECVIGFNGVLLLEILRHQKTEKINLLTSSPLGAMLIEQENEKETETTTLLMPIRI